MKFKDIILKFARLESLIKAKVDEEKLHTNYYTKKEIDALFNNTLGYEILEEDEVVINTKINKKKAISNNK